MAEGDDTANDGKSKTMRAIAYYEANKAKGITPNAASVKFGISAAAVYRKMKALAAGKAGTCPTCGQELNHTHKKGST